ncbi:hypothetical protein CK203_006314 [Vitis vinifera]|uniref:Uncharacterized protein n=1 Tax=Vitis vinifera TaxID=29760 RepID=A0A438KBD7_VITVI|nr:hypothetical protein CK203_006314 [Vitis vinifera]
MKKWHDQLISNKEYQKGQRVLLYDSRLHIFPGKLKSRWIGPFIIHQVHLNGVVELLNSNSTDTFKINGHRLKPFIEPFKQKMRKLISLSHRKPNQKRVRWTWRNCKEIEGMPLGAKRSSKARENSWPGFRSPKVASAKMALGCEMISQPQEVCCEIRPCLRTRPLAAK